MSASNCAHFRAVGTLPRLGFVFEDTLGLEVSYCISFAIAKGKKRIQFVKDFLNRALWI